MHARTLLFLFLAVGVLGALAWWQLGQERAAQADQEAALVAGFDRSRVRALRVDNVERSLQLRIERDPVDDWRIVDPIDFPAERAVVEVLLDCLESQHLRPLVDADPRKLALDPPRVVFEIEEQVGAELLTRRIEIGQADYDPQWGFVRVDGRIGRTERALDTTLERDLPDWRSRSILSLRPREVVEMHRSGTIAYSGADAPEDLRFDALLDVEWRSTSPFVATLDPEAMQRLLLTAVMLRAQSFIDDPGALEFYGLDQPAIRLEFVHTDGTSQALRLAREPRGELWYACREDRPYVYRITDEFVLPISPPTKGLVDRRVFRVVHERVSEVTLTSGESETLLRRGASGWRVSARRAGREVLSSEPADATLVADTLGALERARADELLFDRRLDEGQTQGSITVVMGDEVQRCVLGGEYSAADGVRGTTLRREHDALVLLVDSELGALAQRDATAWRSLELHRVPEIEVARIELASGGAELAFARGEQGTWVRMGGSAEAKEFAKLVDGLLSMRAVEVLKRGDEQLERPLVLHLRRYSGADVEFALGDWTAPDGTTCSVYRSGERFARVKPELAEALRGMFPGQ